MTRKDFRAAVNEYKSADDIEQLCVMGQWLLENHLLFSSVPMSLGQNRASNGL
jgi:hypothetical protein